MCKVIIRLKRKVGGMMKKASVELKTLSKKKHPYAIENMQND